MARSTKRSAEIVLERWRMSRRIAQAVRIESITSSSMLRHQGTAAIAAVAILICCATLVQGGKLAAFRPLSMLLGVPPHIALSDNVDGSHGGGVECAACSIGLELMIQLADVHNMSIGEAFEVVCKLAPSEYQAMCNKIVSEVAKEAVPYLLNKLSPDDACLKMGVCTDPTCRAFSGPNRVTRKPLSVSHLRSQEAKSTGSSAQANNLKGLMPAADLDGDGFSVIPISRGSDWRGRDCVDIDKSVHPGIAPQYTDDSDMDHNCNGIYGVNDDTGHSWEQDLCDGTGVQGFAVIGDSATAHFHIPPQYFEPAAWETSVFTTLPEIVANSFDWPQRGGFTGFRNDSMGGLCPGPLDSFYLRVRERNRCAHNDYQNLGVNGAAVREAAVNVHSLLRDAQRDSPLLLFHALIGNDICDPSHDYMERMTTPEHFHDSVMETLSYLETNLPKGSHVVFQGLVDGRILFNLMHNQTHPLGVNYVDVYDYLNCLGVNPCYLWLNSNETLRNIGSTRAAELNQVYVDIVANYSSDVFDLHYVDYPVEKALQKWVSEGGNPTLLVEPADGFHPSQIAQSLMVDILWTSMESEMPNVLGKENPNNAKIQQLFGDQQPH